MTIEVAFQRQTEKNKLRKTRLRQFRSKIKEEIIRIDINLVQPAFYSLLITRKQLWVMFRKLGKKYTPMTTQRKIISHQFSRKKAFLIQRCSKNNIYKKLPQREKDNGMSYDLVTWPC
uniref:Uncharacterized protein n=1 Tax=Micrurus lemniscatus lemniscatus TaxID=129467 RepID=A0A2D4IRS8_MICLE